MFVTVHLWPGRSFSADCRQSKPRDNYFEVKHYRGTWGEGPRQFEITVEAGESVSMWIELNHQQDEDYPSDWSVTTWGVSGPVRLTHDDGLKSDEFPNLHVKQQGGGDSGDDGGNEGDDGETDSEVLIIVNDREGEPMEVAVSIDQPGEGPENADATLTGTGISGQPMEINFTLDNEELREPDAVITTDSLDGEQIAAAFTVGAPGDSQSEAASLITVEGLDGEPIEIAVDLTSVV